MLLRIQGNFLDVDLLHDARSQRQTQQVVAAIGTSGNFVELRTIEQLGCQHGALVTFMTGLTADQILDSIKRYCERINRSGH